MTIQIEIDKDKLLYLFEQGVLCAADFRCLNGESKQAVSQLCLTNCAKRLQIKTCTIPISVYKQTH
ncbi:MULTISPECIES: hypothetical protein [Psychromonas]|uniref:hypothetical protein n=1 Tax=Psychromonas TaxID=67572 RepID=UPI0004279F79|nr:MULTISPECIES: hypothetical protein [Psychromonas]MBB1271508.1 hypothetical protein [Psychromonas sp. SR45-3]